MLPSVVVGGILLAIALSTGTATDTGMQVTNPVMKNLNDLGSAGFAMMIPNPCRIYFLFISWQTRISTRIYLRIRSK